MNAGTYKLVFNKRLGMLVPIAEVLTARHGGGAGRSRSTNHGIRLRLARLAGLVGLALLSLGLPGGIPLVIAQTVIAPDGRTLTVVGKTGTVWNVNTSTLSGSNAFNSFSAFSVGAGSTVNLHVPSAAANLINIVRDQRTDVYGILNAIKDGHIGGNVWFANPHGFVVGAGGVVNVGSLTVTTPTQRFVDDFFTAPGSPNSTSVGHLLTGTAPRNASGLISIQGRVNALDGVKLDAGSVDVAGSVYSGARFTGTAPTFSDVVNANGLVSATNVVVREGRIEIVADGDVSVSGTLAAPGGSGVRGGDVAIRAGGNVDLQSGALVAARGNGDHSAGGTVNIRADRDAVARTGALVDASGGSSGDGGFIEFSAKNTVDLAGGEFRADGTGGGKGGSVLIDPANIIVSADILRGAGAYGSLPAGAAASGANLTLLADNEITVNDNVTVSTRSVAGTTAADHTTGASTAASGNLTLEAGSISLKSGSKLLAGADSGFAGGDVTLKATRNWTGEARIGVDHATITGRNVALTASATYNDSILTSWLPVVVPVTVATIDIDAGTIAASGTLSLGATSIIKVSSSGLSPLGMITAVSASTVDVHGASVLTAGGNTTLASSSTVTSKATPGGPNPATLPGDAGVATNVVVSTARTHVGDTSSVTVGGGTLDLTARNAVTATTTADSTAGGAVAIGGTLALSEVTSVTQAVIDGSATTGSAALTVGAEASSVVTTSAKAASKGAKKQTAAEKAAAPSETEKNLAKYKDQTTTSDGTVDVAAAVAIANVNTITLADMASTGPQASIGAATVSSKASSSSTVTADGSSASGTVGVGAAVGVNIGVLVNQARVAGNANLSSSGLTVSAVMPVADAKNRFVTSATSGAGASSVGVAGALATNVLVNTNLATLEGGGAGLVNLNGGDLVVESKNTSESTATAGASVKPASATEPAAVGVGASVGINVAVNTTVAEIGDGAVVNGAKDIGLTAKGTHTLTTAATGGAAGADISVTPVAAITVAANTTTARLGTGSLAVLSGAFTASAEQASTTTSTATGQTQGNNVAVGASIALNSATDTVVAEIERNVTATGDVGVNAKSVARSSASATASVSGGEKATDTGAPPAKPDGSAGGTVDEKVTAQGAAAKDAGKKTAEQAAASSPTAAGLAAAAASTDPDTRKAAQAAADKSPASAGLAVAAASNDSKTKVEQTKDAPKTEETTESGGVAVAAAVGVNVGIATTTASVGKGRTITSTNGALKVTSANETDTSAKADGSQVDPGNTSVGVGAAVALNAGISTNVAAVGDDAVVNAKGLTISAVNVTGQASDSKAEATSGAGAGDVGVAGSLAANVAINTTAAVLAGDAASGGNGTGAVANANDGDILIEAGSKTTGAVASGAKVTDTGGTAKVGVGASIGVNVGVNTTVAEVGDKAVIAGGKDFGLNARADHALTTDVTGGAAGARVAVTPLVAATVAVNTTTARLGEAKVGDAGIGITGKYSSTADHTASATTTATGQTQGNSVAIGASIGLTVATDTVTASLERDVDATTGVELGAKSVATSSTSATASVAGGEKADADDKPPAKPDGTAGKTVDQKVAGQQTKATDAGKAAATKAPATTPVGGTGATAKLDETKAPPTTEEKDDTGQDKGGGVSVAAAVGVNAGIATTTASVAKGKKISSRNGALTVKSAAQLDAKAKADGSQVNGGNTDVGVGAAVALNLGVGTNVAVIGDNADVDTKGVTVQAVMAVTPAKGAVPEDKTSDFGADAKSGAGANNVGVAGALAVNTVVNTTVAAIEGDKDTSGAGANVNATTAGGAGDVLVAAQSATKSTVVSGADVKMEGDKANVGVGASVGLNVAVNTTVAEIADAAVVAGGNNLELNAKADHVMSTTVTGGAAGAKVAVTPLAALSMSVNTTTARLGSGAALDLAGTYGSKAEQTSDVSTVATGQTQGNKVAVGASVGLTVAVDTVVASIERDVDADAGVTVEASSIARSSTSATASVAGGAKEGADGKPEVTTPASGGTPATTTPGKTADEQVKAQSDAGKGQGKAAATKAPATTPAGGTGATAKLDETKAPPTTEEKDDTGQDKGGGVSVAAAVGVNAGIATTTASVAKGKKISSRNGALTVKSAAQLDAKAKADGSQVNGGNTDVGVGAAVALNLGVGTNVAVIGDNADVDTKGVTVQAVMAVTPAKGAVPEDKTSDFGADAKSGAGANNVGVAGALAVNTVVNTTVAAIEGDKDTSGAGANVNATTAGGAGDVLVAAQSATKSTVVSGADVKMEGDKANVGVGASVGLNVAVNTTVAEVGDAAVVAGGNNLELNAKADHVMSTTVTGGAAGAKVAITPVAAVSIAVNTTTARAGGSGTTLGLGGELSVHADQTDIVTTKATGQAQGDVAVGASLAAAVVVETVSASVERGVSSSSAIDLGASSESSVRTAAVAGAKGAKAAKKDADGKETPEAGTTVDEQKKNQLDSAKKRNDAARTLDTDSKTPAAETPEVNKNETTEVKKDQPPAKPPAANDKKQESKKVSVAAAIGVGVVVNQAQATIGGAGRSVSTTGKMGVKATTDTNYETTATGEAVSDNVGVAAAVALTGTFNKTQANVAAGSTVAQAGDIDITAVANQNRAPAFRLDMAAEAVSGASGGDVAVAGSLAVVGNYNETRASIDEDVTIGTGVAPVGDITVKADETSKLAVRARAGALSAGKESKAGVGASFAAILSYNKTTAAVGYDTPMADTASNIYANSLTVAATKHKVDFVSPLDVIPKSIGGVQTWVKNFDFDMLDPLNYLGSNNYYTEAVAGAAAKGDAAVAGAFAVNLFMNTTEAYLGKSVHVTTSGSQAGTHAEKLGVEVAARSDTQAIAFAGGVAGAKKAGVGISNTDIVNFDETNAAIGGGSVVKAQAADSGVKVTADAAQVVANVAVSGGVGTESTGVGGVLGIDLSMNKAEASIGEAAQVQAEGNLSVGASNDSVLVMIAGGVGGGKEVGVGGAVGINALWNRTLASIARDAVVDAKKNIAVAADADEVAVTAVVSGAGGGKAGVAASLAFNVILADTEASLGQGVKLNTSAGFGNAEMVAITAHDDSVVVGVSGGGAGGGDAGVGAALDTDVVVKTVKAFIADDTVADGKVATIKADKGVTIDAAATEAIVSIGAGFAGGGKAGVGGSVAIAVVANDVQAYAGKSASIDSDGNVLIRAQDDTTAVLTAIAGAGGGTAGVGGSLAVATVVGSTKAYVGESAQVNARGLGDAASVYTGETGKITEAAKGLAVTAYNTENVVTTDVSGAGGGNAGVAVSLSGNVIANTAEAYIGRSAKINESNAAAGADQQVLVKAVNETVLVNNAGGAGFGGTAGVGAAANLAVIAKNTRAWIGNGALVNARRAVELDATSSEVAVGGTLGFAIGGSAGVGASLGGIGLGSTTEAYIEDAASAASAAKVNVSGGDLRVEAGDLATTTLLTGGGGGGGSAGVGGAIAVSVNASKTRAKIGNFAETNASGTTAVHADSVENTNTVTVAGAGGGSAGVAGAASIKVVASKTEAGIGDNAKVNQDAAYQAAGQDVDVKATDKIITVGVGGVGAGGGAAGVGGSADITVVLNTTTAYIGDDAKVDAFRNASVAASSEKYVNSATFAGAGGGSAGVAGGISVISVGSLLDGEARSGLSPKDENGNPTTTQKQADDLTTKSSVGDLLGTSAQSQETKGVLDTSASKMAVSEHVGRTAPITFKNTQSFIGDGAEVKAGGNVTVSASDTTLAILAAGAGAGGAAAGVAGTLGVVLVHDSAEAFIASNAKVDAGDTVAVNATTGENVFNVGVTGAGAGAAAVNGSIVVNVVSSDTSAHIGAADINTDAAMDALNSGQSVAVTADSSSNIVTVAGSGGGAGAAAVGAVLNVNVLEKTTKAYIGEGAYIVADKDVDVVARSAENVVGAGISIRGAGAAAVGAVVSTNVIANTTEAFIGSAREDSSKTAATIDSDGNVKLSAVDDSLIVALSVVGNGAGAAGVGAAVGANVVSSQTRAYVGDKSSVTARGSAAGTTVYSGSIADATAAEKPPAPPKDIDGNPVSGDIDFDRDGVKDGSVNNGVELTAKAKSDDGSTTESTFNPGAAKDADGNPIAGASGGMGSKGTETVKGLSILAMTNEKMVTATLGVAGAGAAAVTGAATANVISSVTEAGIGDGAQINQGGATANSAVRVRAVDNTFMVQAGGTVAGAGAAAVSGTVNTGIVAKTTAARIGDADVKASDVEVTADSSEKIFTLTANVSIAGAAGVGAALGVDVITNTTTAGIGAGADVDATDDISVTAKQNSLLNVNTVAGAGGIAGVSGAVSVAVIANKTMAYVDGDADPAKAATLNAGGTTAIKADSEENMVTATVSAAGGGVGVAGAIGVKVVKSETDAYIGQNTSVNQTRHGATQNVAVDATDNILLVGVGGAATRGVVGVGATLDVNVVANTTSAHIDGGAKVDADQDVTVAALSDKIVNSTTFAGSGGAVGVAGAVSIIAVGSLLDGEAKSGLNGDGTGSFVDGKLTDDKVSGQLGTSEHVADVKADVSDRTSKQGVADDLKGIAPPPLKRNTMAFIDSGAHVKAGDDVSVTARDKTLAVVSSGAGAVGLFAGVAGTAGVVLLHDSAEAYVADGAWVDAGKTLTVAAATEDDVFNLGITGSGAAAVAAGGSIVVNVVTSDTDAYIGDADINKHGGAIVDQSVAVTADSASNIITVAGAGGVAGGASIGGVINVNALEKTTKAYIASGADVAAGRNVDVLAKSSENVVGAGVTLRGAGLGAAGAVISANVVDNTTEAFIDGAKVDSDGNVRLSAVDDTLIVAVSAVANGAGGMGIGLNVGANVISNETRAYVSGASQINARGNAAGSSVYTGALSATPGAMPALPAGQSGSADIDRDGSSDGEVSGGASFDVGGKSVDPAAAKASDGSDTGAAGGLGAKGTETVKGLSVVAMNNEKMITATVGVALAGGRAQTGASTANVISSVTEASIGDGAQINMSGAVGADRSVRVRAADNTLMVQVGGTFAGAGAMGMSGAIDSGIVNKQTYARIGDADVKASNVEVTADSSEDVYNVTVNAALAGGLAMGGAAGVDVIRNKTYAGIGAGANIDATGDLRVHATQDSAIDLYTISGAAAGLVGVSGAVSVGVIANETRAYVEGSASNAATLNAGGTTAVVADSAEKITSVTVSGAGGGLAGVAGAVAVKVVESKTEAFIGSSTRVNQTRSGAAQDVVVSASDAVTLRGGGGSVALAGYAGVGAAAEINIVRNTTTAYIDDFAVVDADRDLSVSAASTKDVQSAAIAAAGGLSVGIGGALSVVTIGAKLDDESQNGLRDAGGGGNTATSVDGQIGSDKVSGQLGDSEHVQGMKTDVASGIGGIGVAAKMNESSTASLDKTRAYIGGGSQVTAGRDATVSATDKVKLDIKAAGAAGGFVGLGGALGVGVVRSTTEAFVGSSAQVEAGDQLTVEAKSENLDANGSRVTAVAGAGGIIGLSAAVAVMNNTSSTQAYAGSGSTLSGDVTFSAVTNTKQSASATGIAVGVVAVGASIASVGSDTDTRATLGSNVNVSGAGLDVEATGTDDNFAAATAGSGGLIAGSAASATTGSTSNTLASVGAGDGTHQASVGSFRVNASHTTRFNGEVDSLNASLAGASGAFASHAIDSTVLAEAGDDARILANSVSIGAENRVEKDWLRGASGDAAAWNIRAGSGGVIGAPAGRSESTIEQATTARVGDDAKIHVLAPVSGDGVFTLDARNVTIARDKAKLDSGGAIAIAKANSMVNVDRADATASFGANAEVISDVGSIDAGSRNDATLETRAAADTYGLAGAPDGSAHTVYRGATNTVIGAGALLRTDDGAVNLAAGRDSSGNAGGIDARSAVNLWNKTAIPIPTLPDALTSVVNNADLTVTSGANLKAATDITLTADRGGVFANAIGIGKDIYRETLAAIASGISNLFGGDDVSFDVRGGSSAAGGFAGVRVDGNVETGIYKDASLTLDVQNYNAATRAWDLKVTRSRGVAEPTIEFQVGIAADINKRRTLLVKLAKEYSGTAAGDAYQAEVDFLEHKLVELGLAHVDGTGAIILGTGGGTGISPRAAALTRVGTLTTQKNDIVDNQLPPVESQLGTATTARDTALDNYNNVFTARATALSLWAIEAAKGASADADYIAARKTEVATAESTLTARGATGWVAQAAAASPNVAVANTERSDYNTNTVSPLQTQVTTLTDQKTALEVQRDNLADNLFVLNRQITGYTDTVPDPDVVYPPLSNVAPSGPAADFVTAPNIKAQLGSIRVTGDALTGSGKLKAPGDARVTITNNTPDYLIVKDITVDADAARVAFNGVDVASNADISRLNGPGHSAGFSEIITGSANPSQPSVTITSTYDPNSSPYRIGAAPDIRLTGNISNPRGLVQVHSAAGSILSQGNIYAGTVDIKAANGDFVQSYVDNFFHIGGDPKAIYEGTATPGGVVANGSVFISSRYININGVIQSGIASYALTLPSGGAILTGSASMLGLTSAGNNQQAMDDYRVAHPTGITTFYNDNGVAVTYNAAKNRLEVSEAFAIADAASVKGRSRNPTGEYALVSDYGNVGVRYDTANNRYLINGTEVKGGYIQLFGQVINTAKPDAGGNNAGKLLVLDGYGQINIANPSGKDIVIARLDAGQGTAGVIDITDIQYIDANKAAHSIRSVFTRENGNIKITQKGRWTLDGSGLPLSFDDNWTDTSTAKSVVGATGISGATSSRTATYSPQPGLAFTYTTGQDQSTYEDFSYEGTQFIGISSWRTWPNLTDYRIAGPYKSGTPMELTNGRYLSSSRSLANGYATSSNTVVTNGPAQWKTNNEYTYCDWWSLCITQTYHIDFSRITPTKDIVSTFLRADSPISIQFIGGDYGAVSVKSAQNAILTGTISNKTGTTTIVAGNSGTGVTAANKSIVQGNDDALIISKDLVLGASGSIGATLDASPARLIRTAISGDLTADAANGNVLLRQTLGDLKVDTVTAVGSSPLGTSRVTLQAEGSILAAVAGSSRIEADRVDLTSDTGSIGSVATPLLVNVGYTDDTAKRPYYGLKAVAQGDIGVATATWAGNADGNLLVDTVVSAGGDVKLVAPGRIIDNNPIERVDTRTWSELLAYWDSLALREGSAENLAKQQQAVKAFEFGKTANYQLYWQMRQRQADPASYNPGFVYSVTPAERQALTDSGMSGAQITVFEANRTAQYHQLNTDVGSLNGGSFSAGYSYVATTAESDAILHKSSWTDRELAISVSPGLLKNITNTNPVIKSANVQGKTVTLKAGVAIGETTGDMTIPTSTAPSALTDEQKVALAVAERADIGITDSLITVRQRKPFNFDAATALDVSVTPAASAHADNGKAFLASLGDGLLGNISAPGDTRIKVQGSILNAPTSLVQTGNLILEAANGGVGYVPSDGISPAMSQPLQLSLLPGATLTSRGAGDVDVVETGDLNVDTVFSRGKARLTAAGSILDAYAGSELNVLAGSVTLTPGTGSVGTDANPLDVGVTDPLGRITATSPVGKGIFLNGPLGAQFNIGSILSGDAVWLSSDLGALIDGTVGGPGAISLVSGGTITMTPKADVHATTSGVFLRAGSLVMQDAQRMIDRGEILDPKYVTGDAAQIRVDVGTIDIQTTGDALITGIRTGNTTESAIRIVSTAGRILDNGDTRLDIIADQGNARLTISGALGIGDDPLDVRLVNLDATSGGVADLAAQGPLNIVGITASDRVLLSATGDITGDAVTSTGTGGTNPDQTVSITSTGGGVTLASVSGTTGVSIAGQAGVAVDAVNVGTSVQLAAPVITAVVNGGAGPVGGSVTGFGGGIAGHVTLTLSGAGGFALGNFWAANATVDNPLGSLGIGSAIISDRATFSNPQTLLLVDQHDKSLQPADIQLYSAGGPFSMYMTGNQLTTEAMVIHSNSSHEVFSASGPSVSAVQQGDDTLARIKLSPAAPSGGGDGGHGGSLVSFSGTPVSTECSADDPECAQ